MIKKLKLKKIGLDETAFDALVVSKIIKENNIHFVQSYYCLFHNDDYFIDIFERMYQRSFKDLKFIKDIRQKLINEGIEKKDLLENILDELSYMDKRYMNNILNKIFKVYFEVFVTAECRNGEDSYISNHILRVEKELYKKLKSEMEVA